MKNNISIEVLSFLKDLKFLFNNSPFFCLNRELLEQSYGKWHAVVCFQWLLSLVEILYSGGTQKAYVWLKYKAALPAIELVKSMISVAVTVMKVEFQK